MSLELVEGSNKLPVVHVRASRAEADLTTPSATKVAVHDLIAAIVDYSLTSTATSFELVATAAAKPKLLSFARFEAGAPYKVGEQN